MKGERAAQTDGILGGRDVVLVNACGKRLVLLVALAVMGAGSAHGFGVAGHAVAAAVAEPRLCTRARDAVARFGRSRSLEELGIWADRIRYVPVWEHTAPWHYMNIADDEALSDYRTPEEGDVLWAIGHFAERLGDDSLPLEDGADALRFLVHFIVDIHQPLHVGRADDRGGNAVTFTVDGERTNLHRLWDSGLVSRNGGPSRRYIASAVTLADASAVGWAAAVPREWAAESKRLRAVVYDFDVTPSVSYLAEAERLVQRRLAQAGVRLAETLNRIFC